MARMFPSNGPVSNQSRTAEPLLYHALATQLPDEFTVIHSLPWLAQAAKSFDGRFVPTGELDFLILHPSLGVLAIEVKGGQIAFEQNIFFIQRTGAIINPIDQVRRSMHGLSHWIVEAGGPAYKWGYAIAFPESSMQDRNLPPALIDTTDGKQQNICIDKYALSHINTRIVEIMHYWQRALNLQPLGDSRLQQIVNVLCPIADYTPNWKERIEEHSARWLVLTPQQSSYLERFQQQERTILSGRSGTGKTLLAIAYARQLEATGKRVLFLTFNALLADNIRWILKDADVEHIVVRHYHALCRESILALGSLFKEHGDWHNVAAPRALKHAVTQEKVPQYDALIIDEAQAFDAKWLADLEHWFVGKPMLACCDETQIFPFEKHTSSLQELEEVMHTQAFTLTTNARSPYVIFDRLQRILPPVYEQFSPRPEEADALQEIATLDPLATLYDTIQQLHAEGIPSSSIMVIYTGWQKPAYPKDKLPFVPQTESVSRSRGLEAPVVIVWNNQWPDDAALICAYSRATSRCIAIYNRAHILENSFSNETSMPKSLFHSFLRQKIL